MYDFVMPLIALENLQISLFEARIAALDGKWVRTYTLDPYHRLYYIIDGEARMRHSHKDFVLSPGRHYLIPRNTVLSYSCPAKVTIAYAHFQAYFPGEMDFYRFTRCPLALAPRDTPADTQLWQELTAGHRQRFLSDRIKCNGLFQVIFSRFFAGLTENDLETVQVIRLKEALDYMETRLTEKIALDTWAETLNLTGSSFSRLFSRTMGMPPFRYLHSRRVEEAQYLLWQTGLSLGEIAQQLGYSDAYHLSKTFKDHMGISPRDFRKLKTPRAEFI